MGGGALRLLSSSAALSPEMGSMTLIDAPADFGGLLGRLVLLGGGGVLVREITSVGGGDFPGVTSSRFSDGGGGDAGIGRVEDMLDGAGFGDHGKLDSAPSKPGWRARRVVVLVVVGKVWISHGYFDHSGCDVTVARRMKRYEFQEAVDLVMVVVFVVVVVMVVV